MKYYAGSRASGPDFERKTPEMSLRFALIYEAVHRVLFEASRPVRSPDWLTDYCWIYSDEARSPFSFLYLCELLDINAEWVRERITDALTQGDPLQSPTFAQGRKRCRLTGLLLRDEAKRRGLAGRHARPQLAVAVA